MSANRVSWLVIEPGWRVVVADGTEVGHVDELIGDTGKDIFNGLAVTTGLLAKPRYVPAESVAEITEGTVQLSMSAEEVGRLAEYEPPPASAEILPP